MFRIRKYLNPYMFMFVVSVILLFIQANFDLALPDYLSQIVNTGIQQSGVDSPVPLAMRQSTLEHVLLFVDEDDAAAIQSAYSLIEPNTLEADDYVATYPLLEDEAIYVRNDLSQDEVDALTDPLAQALLVVGALTQMMENPDAAAQFSNGDSPFNLSQLPLAQTYSPCWAVCPLPNAPTCLTP